MPILIIITISEHTARAKFASNLKGAIVDNGKQSLLYRLSEILRQDPNGIRDRDSA